MDKPKILSGNVLVAKGVTKQSVTLPEVGYKDVIPNGSWLEQKQIQTALDSQKQILDVDRIEKIGNISHAAWRDDLQRAEVTQKCGSCWQYFGYNIGKALHLRPEEVLFLMEVNSLLLKHNDITVSLQKAFSLVLNSNLTYNQYRVYASLSRLGYKVFRHNKCINDQKINDMTTSDLSLDTLDKHPREMVVENVLEKTQSDSSNEVRTEGISDVQSYIDKELPNTKPNNSTDIQEHQDNKTIEGDIENNETDNIKDISCLMEEDASDTTEIIKDTSCVMEEDATDLTEIIKDTSCVMEEDATDSIENVKGTSCVMKEDATDSFETINISEDNMQSTTTSLASKTLKAINNLCEGIVVLDDIPLPRRPESQVDYKICKEKTNLNCSKNDKNGVTAMDVNNECCQAAADSIVQSNESHGGAGPSNSQDRTNDTTKTELSDNNKSICFSDALISNRHLIFQNYVTKLKRLTERQFKPSSFINVDEYFDNVPDFYGKDVVVIHAPPQEHIPKNVFVNKSSYILKIKNIRRKRSDSGDGSTYNSSDDNQMANDNQIGRLRSISNTSQNWFTPNNFWRHPNNLNYVQFNMVFQRPSFSNVYFHSRLQYQPRPNSSQRHFSYQNSQRHFSYQNSQRHFSNQNPNNALLRPNNINNNPRKRMRNDKSSHLASIMSLCMKLKQLVMNGNYHRQNVESLHRLLYAYNVKYKTCLRLTREFDVVNDEDIMETIDLGDDDERRIKIPKLNQESDMFDGNLNSLRDLANKLKNLNAEKKGTPKHMRVLSKAIQTFNKSYDADIYINANFEIIDRRLINIDSDSESDCVVNLSKKSYKGKKLRNPFSILKRRSEQQGEPIASTSKDTNAEILIDDFVTTEGTLESQNLSKVFNKNWLPGENDFGRPVVVNKNVMNSLFLDIFNDQFLLNYVNCNVRLFTNWLDAKIAFLQHMKDTDIACQNEHKQQVSTIKESVTQSELKPLLDPEDCSNTASILEKLRIIKNNEEVETETTLTIDFDAYRKEITNFKKTNPPRPHFRIIVLDESSMFPSNADVVSIVSKCGESVPLVFAIVGTSSISYVQFRPIDMPVYVASNDLD